MTTKIELYKALLKFQANVSNIQKDTTNPFFKSKYASLGNILDNINDILVQSGLVVMQHPTGDSDCVRLKTIVMHADSGECIESEFSMVPVKRDPQGIGSCITYMRRYALATILKLNVDEDDDGNKSSHKQAEKQYRGHQAEQYSDPVFTFSEVKAMMNKASTLDALGDAASLVKELNITQEQRDGLAAIYKAKQSELKNSNAL